MNKDQQNFEKLIQEAYERIPEVFREACSDVMIRAEAVPSVEVLTALDFRRLSLVGSLSWCKSHAEERTRRELRA